MVRRYYDLPSLTALAIFEAAARHLSFKLAAAELNVTPGAVSKQIKVIEDELGLPLFVRTGAGVTLTDAGADVYAALSDAFSRISGVVREVKRGDRSKNVTIACTDAFASMWLIPRMPDFWSRFPDIAVNHVISDIARDFRRAEVELRVRYGLGAWPDETAELLFDETVYPVCGPGFAAKHRGAGVDDLADLPLLHVDWVDPSWEDWEYVLRRAGAPRGSLKGRRFGKFSVCLQAAQADQGVAIGWDRLVAPLIAKGRLARLTDLELPALGGYYLTWNERRALSSAALTLRSWLRENAERERRDAIEGASV